MSATVGFLSMKTMLTSKRVHQTFVLYLSLLVSLGLGIAVSVINTRWLGPHAFGDLKFIQTTWTLGVLFVTFGLFTTGGNLLALQTDHIMERRLMGSLLLIAVVVSFVFILLMLLASYPLGQVYGKVLGGRLRLFAALIFVFPLQVCLQDALRGSNDITGLSLLNVLPQAAYIPAALLVRHYVGFDLEVALLLYLVTIALTVFVVTVRARPSLDMVGVNLRQVLANNRSLGFHIYAAVLVTTATTQLSQFTLAYFHGTRLVGMFALAITITMPLTMIPNAISTTFFKQFATLDRIPRKVVWAAITIPLMTMLVFVAIIREVILFLYTESFIDVVSLTYICAMGAVLHGIGDVYNRYLLAHGEAGMLRRNAMQLGGMSTLGYIFLVMWWGAMGAAMTKVITDSFYLLAMFMCYRKVVKA